MWRSLSMLMFEDFMLMTWSRLLHLAISWVSRLCPPSSQINWLHTTAKNVKSPWIMLVIICSLRVHLVCLACLVCRLHSLHSQKPRRRRAPKDGHSDSDSHFSASSGNSSARKSSQSQMTHVRILVKISLICEQCSLDLDGEHSSENQFDASSAPLKTKLQQFKRSKNLAVT